MNSEEAQERILKLERTIEMLERRRLDERDDSLRKLASTGLNLIYVVLGLIAMAIVLRSCLEYVRLQQRPINPAITCAECVPGKRLSPEPGPERSHEPEVKHKLDNYVDNPPGKSGGGNSYSVSLSGLDKLLDSLVKTGEITAEKAAGLMQELGKEAIGTTGEIVRETAKAIIARYLGPKPEPKEAVGGPLQQVQVNVYPNEKRITDSPPKQPAPPKPKPKPPCPPPATDTKPLSCPAEPLIKVG